MNLSLVIKGERETAERMARFFGVPITIVKEEEGYVVAQTNDSSFSRIGAWYAADHANLCPYPPGSLLFFHEEYEPIPTTPR